MDYFFKEVGYVLTMPDRVYKLFLSHHLSKCKMFKCPIQTDVPGPSGAGKSSELGERKLKLFGRKKCRLKKKKKNSF